jgi:hypothetical protein
LIIPRANAGIHGVGYADKGYAPAAGTALWTLTAALPAFHIMELLFQHA